MCAALVCAASCKFAEPEWVTPIGLGAKQNVVDLPSSEAGESRFDIVSDCDFEVNVIQGGEWIEITDVAAREIGFTYTRNNGFKRSAKVEISAPGRRDTLTARQPGPYTEYITIPSDQKTFNVSAQGGQFKVDFATNILFKDLRFDAGSAQIQKVVLSKNSIFFEVLPTTSRDARSFTLSIYAIDGWNEKVQDVITLNQAKAQ